MGGWPLFAKSLLTDLDPENVQIVAVDALPAQLPYVETGIAPVLLAQPIFDWGYISVNKIVDKCLLGKEVPEINKMELITVDKDSLGDWARKLKEWQFSDVPNKYLEMGQA